MSIIFKDVLYDIVDELKRNTEMSYSILHIISFGSRKRGDFRNDSDWDILIVIKQDDSYLRQKLINYFYNVRYRRNLDFDIEPIIYSIDEFESRKNTPFI